MRVRRKAFYVVNQSCREDESVGQSLEDVAGRVLGSLLLDGELGAVVPGVSEDCGSG